MPSDDRASRVILQEPQLPVVDSDVPALKNAFLTQLRSKEFPNALTELLASQEGVNAAMSLQGDDALTLVDVLDQAFEAPNMDLDLRRRSVRLLRSVCGSQTILPRSCTLSDNISKEADVKFASGGFADVWKGRHNGNHVCVKAFRAYTACNLSKIKQRLFQEIVIWKRLSHPNVLPVLGVSPKLFPLCVVTEWMIDGNIMDFTSKHPEANRLRLLAEAVNGLQYLHSMDIVHSDLKPTNILIDSDFHPRLTDYGLIAIISDPNTVDPGSTTSPSVGAVRYMAPELLNPSGFGLRNSNPTKKSDIYTFGVVTYQVITGQQPFPGARDGVIIYSVVTGERPNRPLAPNEWVSDDIWDFISRCWSPSWDSRPDVNFAMNTLNDAADAVGVRRGKMYLTTDDQEKSTSCLGSGIFPPSLDPSRRRAGYSPIQDVLQPRPPAPKIPKTPSPFVTKIPTGSRTTKKERERIQQRGSRTWPGSTGSHRQEAAFVDYQAGIVHLSSSDGTPPETRESKPSVDDLNHIQSQDVYKQQVHRRLHTSQPSRISTTPSTHLEPWEADLIAFFRVCKPGVGDSPEREKTFMDFFRVCIPRVGDGPERKKARRFADRLDLALDNRHLPKQKQTQHLRYLRKLCGTFGILPSSFVVAPRSVKCATTPFATGGFSDVYKATFKGRPVAIKTLKVTTTVDPKKVHRFLAKEVVGWKWLQHENILPFVGVMFTPPLISIVSARMENGNIMDFIKAHQKYNRLRLLVGAVTGLKFLHEHDIVHGDLKGANILIDSDYCARLADFGLAVVVEESTSGELKGTTRWMAPELMDPDTFGFIGESQKQLPSKGTDIYAIGMTILEVLTGCRPFNDITKSVTVICRVMGGNRPERPASGFPDTMWELLTTTWVEQRVQEDQRRPPASTVLSRLKEGVSHWEGSIVPLIPKKWQESATGSERETERENNCLAEAIGK